MGQSIARQAESSRVDSLDSIRPTPAKAGLPVNASQSPMRALISEAIRRAGSQKSAAIEMEIDPAQLTRQLQNGHLTVERLEALSPTFAAEFGRLLVEVFGPIDSPQARFRQHARELRDLASAIEEAAELIA